MNTKIKKRFCVIYRLESSKPEDNGDSGDNGQEHEPKPKEDVHLRTTCDIQYSFFLRFPFAIRLFVIQELKLTFSLMMFMPRTQRASNFWRVPEPP